MGAEVGLRRQVLVGLPLDGLDARQPRALVEGLHVEAGVPATARQVAAQGLLAVPLQQRRLRGRLRADGRHVLHALRVGGLDAVELGAARLLVEQPVGGEVVGLVEVAALLEVPLHLIPAGVHLVVLLGEQPDGEALEVPREAGARHELEDRLAPAHGEVHLLVPGEPADVLDVHAQVVLAGAGDVGTDLAVLRRAHLVDDQHGRAALRPLEQRPPGTAVDLHDPGHQLPR